MHVHETKYFEKYVLVIYSGLGGVWITLSVFVISDKLLTTNVHDIPRLLPNV